MATIKVEYTGGLRTTCTHLDSGQQFITDAPTDNNGKGEAISPTDLIGTSYASCMLTVIGIYCEKNGIEFKNGNAEVIKTMGAGPRRIVRLEINLDLSGNNWSSEECEKMINVAETCPVAYSVDSEIVVDINYTF